MRASLHAAPTRQAEAAPAARRTAMATGGLHRARSTPLPLPRQGGQPMEAGVRARIEQSLGQPMGGVEVHAGGQGAQVAAGFDARAVTYGADIYLGAGERDDDLALMAHEAAHVVQQRAGLQWQAAGTAAGGSLEREAGRASSAVTRGESFSVAGSTGPTPQLEDKPPSTWDKIKQGVGDALDFTEDLAWSLLEKYSPDLVPIVRKGPQGVLDWLKDRASAAFEAVVDTVMAPVRTITGISKQLSAQFTPWLAWLRDAAVKISQNDCSPLREAADKIEAVATKVIGYLVDKLQPVFTKVKEWGEKLWDKIGAPIWGWIKEYAAFQWEMLKKLGNWIWDNTAWIRSKIAKAWTWIKNKLGIGEGPEGQNGILQWVQAKLEAVWDKIKVKLAPYQAQILAVAKIVGAVALIFSPAGPFIIAGAAIYGVVKAVQWIKTNWRGNIVVQSRLYLQQTLIPALLGAAKQVGSAVNGVAKQISDHVSRFAASVGGLVGLAAGSALSFLVKGAQWLADQINDLALWASGKLLGLTDWLQSALDKLQSAFEKFLAFLKRVGNIILDVYSLPLALAEKVWNWIPACIRDPVVDFIIPIILRQIELFRDLAADKDAWARTKAEVNRLVRLVFKDRDLKGAVRAAFEFVLRIFNIPIEFLVKIKNKALAAWDTVSKKPLEFIKNTVRSIGNGFKRLWDNILDHLEFGVQGWLLGEISDKGITLPASWTNPKDVFGFVLDVLGLNMDHIFDLLKKRFNEDQVNRAKKIYGYAKKAWNWITSLIDTSKTPAENTKQLVERAKDFGTTVLTGIAEWIAGKVGEELAILATAAAASGGLSEVLDVFRRIYKAMLTAKRWMRKVLDMVDQTLDKVLDIANGQIDKVGEAFEKILHKGMPVVIGFLADQVGLTGVGQALRDIIDGLRAKVDEGILWLIDKLKALIETAISLGKAGVKALLDWWNKKVDFDDEDGEPHKIFLAGSETSPTVYVASDRARLEDIVGQLPAAHQSAAETKRKEIESLIRQLDAAGARGKVGAANDQTEMEDLSDKLDKALGAMAGILRKAGFSGAADVGSLPRPSYSFDFDGDKADGAEVQDLSANRPMGSAPYQNPLGWGYLGDSDQIQGAPYYRRLHLINHRLGGPGQKQNLVPGSQDNNSEMERDYEAPIKNMIGDEPMMPGKKAVLWMKVSVAYRKADQYGKGNKIQTLRFPHTITCKWGYLKNKPKKNAETPQTVVLTVPEPS
ncbi:DUF4157 domain-containing protein [Chitinivorax sp. PXF-14]|uniref:eCIS core domain-containing protein n=1 Tax=Chitinivorax sp. PXF-14 TaxID=3230488 RepID=UPI003466B196